MEEGGMDYPTSAFGYPCPQQEAPARLEEHRLPQGAHAQVTVLSALSATEGFAFLCGKKSCTRQPHASTKTFRRWESEGQGENRVICSQLMCCDLHGCPGVKRKEGLKGPISPALQVPVWIAPLSGACSGLQHSNRPTSPLLS